MPVSGFRVVAGYPLKDTKIPAVAEISHDISTPPLPSVRSASNSSDRDSPAAPPRIPRGSPGGTNGVKRLAGRGLSVTNSPQNRWQLTYRRPGRALGGGVLWRCCGEGQTAIEAAAGNPGTSYHCKFLYRCSPSSAAETLQLPLSPANAQRHCDHTEAMEPSKIKKRAARACSFCRGRKVRCIVTGPSEACTNCKYHEKPCTRTGIW